MANKKRSDLLTAADVARCCRVDMKTIHNWAGRGELPHFRTPGRHLRFQRDDVLDFLRRYGYPVPEWLVDGPPRVALTGSGGWTSDIVESLKEDFEVTVATQAFHILIDAGAHAPDAIVVGPGATPGDQCPLAIVSAIKNHPTTQRIRVVTIGPNEADGRPLGASAHIAEPDGETIHATLASLLGLARVVN